MSEPPLVTVITPTWQRRELLLTRAIPSVQAQGYPWVEHLVISDGPDAELRDQLAAPWMSGWKNLWYRELGEHDPEAHYGHLARAYGTRRRKTRSEHPNWAGDQITYKGLHLRVARERGPASGYRCTHADDTCKGRLQWASVSRQYLGTDDFMPLCQSHHYRYDHQVAA